MVASFFVILLELQLKCILLTLKAALQLSNSRMLAPQKSIIDMSGGSKNFDLGSSTRSCAQGPKPRSRSANFLIKCRLHPAAEYALGEVQVNARRPAMRNYSRGGSISLSLRIVCYIPAQFMSAALNQGHSRM